MQEFLRKIGNNGIVTLLLFTGAVFLFLRFLTPLLSPILVAMLFVTIFGPLLQKMQRIHVCRQAGAVLLMLLALLILAGIVFVAAYWVWNGFPRVLAQAERWKEELPDWARSFVSAGLQELQSGMGSVTKGMLGSALRTAGRLVAFGGWLVTFLIAVILLAKDYDELMNELLGRKDCHLLLSVICGVIRYVSTYVKAQCVIMALIAGLCVIVLSLFGVPQGVPFGLLAGFLDALPFIGTGVVLVPLCLINAMERRFVAAIACAGLYLSCIFLREFLEPRLIGKKMGIRPIFVLISLYVGIHLFGVLGIVKGPLGFVIIWEIWQRTRSEKTKNE